MKAKTKAKAKITKKGAVKKVGAVLKKKAGKVVALVQKGWKDEQPRREKFAKELQGAAKKVFKNSTKVGSDIMKVIKKDLRDMGRKS